MPIAADYPFLDVFWTIIVFFCWVIWFWIVITIFSDLFRRDDIGGWGKAGWIVLIIVLPFLGTLIYLITRPPGATPEERAAMDEASREFVTRYTPSDPAQQLQTLSDLHDRGKLTDAEFAAEKARVLGAAQA